MGGAGGASAQVADSGMGGSANTAGSSGGSGGAPANDAALPNLGDGSAGEGGAAIDASSAADANDGGPKIILFDGTGLGAWTSAGGGAVAWPSTADYFEVSPGAGDIHTKQTFGDIALHVEFWIPLTPMTNAEQDRGNSGIYLQGRYEVQVLDSYNHPLMDANDCGAIYEVKDASSNESKPPETWQMYDITFHAARYNGNTKTSNARISVVWNGKEVQHDTDVPAPTRLGDAESPAPAGLRLQDHGHKVRYRNIWLQEI